MKRAGWLCDMESLIEHPHTHTMTHSDMTEDEKARGGITPSMIRLSVGLDDPDDVIADLGHSLDVLL